MKNQLIIFVESDVVPGLIVGEKSLVVDICETIAAKALSGDEGDLANSYQLTLEYFIQKMVDPGEEFAEDMKPVLRIDDFKEIFNKVSKRTAEKLIETNFSGDMHDLKSVEILIKLL